MTPTNIPQSSDTITKVKKFYSLTWDQATFTWNQAGDSTWDSQNAVPINIAKSSDSITKVNKSPAV